MKSTIYVVDTPVTFELDNESKSDKINEFIDWVCSEYGRDMAEFFIANSDGIFDNKLMRAWHSFPAGMKLSKVLMKEFGPDAEQARQKLSMVIQANKVTGRLCLSVHPLDYLSASENTHGWRSCHALDGEYRAGNLSYMVDDCTIMAYLKSEEDTKLPHFPESVPWNDKKWRCYFYVDNLNGIIYAARQYPFHTDTGLQMVADLFRKFHFFDDNYEREWNQRVADNILYGWRPSDEDKQLPHKYFKHWGIRGQTVINDIPFYFDQTKVIVGTDATRRVVPMDSYIETHSDACCFNDVICSHTYSPWMMVYRYDQDYMPLGVRKKLVVGGPCMCVTCGRHLFKDSDNFQCAECDASDYEDEDESEDEDASETLADIHPADAPSSLWNLWI